MPRILIWTEADVNGLRDKFGLEQLLTEVDNDGTVVREIGLDAGGRVVHRHPGAPTLAKYGVFDLPKVSPSHRADMAIADLERLWSA